MNQKECKVGVMKQLITKERVALAIAKYWKVVTPFGLFIILLIIGQLASPGFLSISYLAHLLTLAAPLGIMTLGQTFVILSGKEDLDFSCGANASLAIVLAALFLRDHGLGVVVLMILLIGAGFGILNGIGVRIVGVPPLIMTFGSAMLLYGVGQAVTRGMSIGTSSPLLTHIALGRIAGLPISFLIWIGLLALAAFVLRHTIYGRWLYAAGSNAYATHIAGISISRVGIVAYAISGALSALAGLLYLGRFAIPSGFKMAEGYTLPCIMAVILGGTSFSGGEGGVLGTVGSVLFLTSLDTFFSIFNIAQAWRIVLNGSLLVLILLFYTRRAKLRL